MSKDLVIVESPAKARTITRILPSSFHVAASMGHVRDLPEGSRLGIDVENKFEPEYEVTSSRKKVIQELKSAAKAAKSVYLATDPDREGEAIAWHIYELLKKQGKDATFHRITFHEITKTAVEAAMEHPGELDMDLVNAQQARRILDRLVGYQVSKLLWRRVDGGISAGRVQSVALRLICEREAEIDNFVPKEYWNLVAHFKDTDNGNLFDARLFRLDGEKPDIGSGDEAEAIASDAEQGVFAISSVKKQPRKRNAAPPFITSTLQQAASSNLRLSPGQTMRFAQQLYEGIDTGSGPQGMITYMRTDSVNIAKEAQAAARDFIGQQFGQDYIPDKPNSYRSRGGAQEAHEAIRPTDVQMTPEKAAKYLNRDQLKLYRLIWNRFMASQMAPAREMRTTVELENTNHPAASIKAPSGSPADTCKHSFVFRATDTTITFPGFLKVYNLHDVEDEDEQQDSPLPELSKGDKCDLTKLDRDQKFTEPPARFSEAMLIRELEKCGVGRPSTYASIVNTIQAREYVAKDKGKLVPSKAGKEVNGYLTTRFPKLFEVDFTARMENQLDEIEQGDQEWVAMLEEFYNRFSDWLKEAKDDGPPTEQARKVLDVFSDDLNYEPPQKRGKRTYDDKKFVTSLSEQLDEGKKLTARQWQALLRIAVKYEGQLPKLEPLLQEEEDEKLLDKYRAKQKELEADPAEETVRIIESMATISKWEEPTTRGKRTYDDKKFYESLRDQVVSGRKLTTNQQRALKRIFVKYREQVDSYDDIKDQVELPAEPETADVPREKLDQIFAMFDTVKEWEPPRGKGRRKYDDKEFIGSLREQHEGGRTLSARQWAALQKVFGKYAGKIENYEEKVKDLDLEAAAPKKAEKTDVTCPKCGKKQLVKRTSRRGVFYGCSGYPKCKYTTDDLEKAKAEQETSSD